MRPWLIQSWAYNGQTPAGSLADEPRFSTHKGQGIIGKMFASVVNISIKPLVNGQGILAISNACKVQPHIAHEMPLSSLHPVTT